MPKLYTNFENAKHIVEYWVLVVRLMETYSIHYEHICSIIEGTQVPM
jgi:hypothetical protein